MLTIDPVWPESIEEEREEPRLELESDRTVLARRAYLSFVVLLTQKFRIWITPRRRTGKMKKTLVNSTKEEATAKTDPLYAEKS